jgi:hypothetical protein
MLMGRRFASARFTRALYEPLRGLSVYSLSLSLSLSERQVTAAAAAAAAAAER